MQNKSSMSMTSPSKRAGSPSKRAGGGGRASPSKADLIKTELERSIPLNERVQLMKQDSRVNDDEVTEYMKTEIIRKSVNDVKARAEQEAARRQSPIKTYSKVKSKIAGNMKSQQKAKKMGSMVADQQYIHEQVVAGNYEVIGGRSPNKRGGAASPMKSFASDASPERTAQIADKERMLASLRSEIEDRRQTGATLYSKISSGENFTVKTGKEVRNFEPENETLQRPAADYEMTQFTVHEATVAKQAAAEDPVQAPAEGEDDLSPTKAAIISVYKSQYAQDPKRIRSIASAKKTQAKKNSYVASAAGSRSINTNDSDSPVKIPMRSPTKGTKKYERDTTSALHNGVSPSKLRGKGQLASTSSPRKSSPLKGKRSAAPK